MPKSIKMVALRAPVTVVWAISAIIERLTGANKAEWGMILEALFSEDPGSALGKLRSKVFARVISVWKKLVIGTEFLSVLEVKLQKAGMVVEKEAREITAKAKPPAKRTTVRFVKGTLESLLGITEKQWATDFLVEELLAEHGLEFCLASNDAHYLRLAYTDQDADTAGLVCLGMKPVESKTRHGLAVLSLRKDQRQTSLCVDSVGSNKFPPESLWVFRKKEPKA